MSKKKKTTLAAVGWKNEQYKVKDLKPFGPNPRQMDHRGLHYLGRSLDKFGIAVPLIVNTDGTLIGGHQRLKILKKRHTKTVEVRVPERQLTEDEVRELNLLLNRVGEWDHQKLGDFGQPILEAAGFSAAELDIVQMAVGNLKANAFRDLIKGEKARMPDSKKRLWVWIDLQGSEDDYDYVRAEYGIKGGRELDRTKVLKALRAKKGKRKK